MKLVYHKIPRVEKSTCTAEQMIAYNLASNIPFNLMQEWKNSVESGFEMNKAATVAKIIKWLLTFYNDGKYNKDAIFCCLNAGLQSYLEDSKNKTGKTLTSYEEVGKAFPALYL